VDSLRVGLANNALLSDALKRARERRRCLHEMTETDYTISLAGVTDRKAFFAELLEFYSPHEVVLTTWGKLPPEVTERLAAFRAHTSWVRRRAFRQSDWILSPQSLLDLTASLCDDDVLVSITWGLIKGETPLGLCRSWDDMNLDQSEWIDEETLCRWLDELKSRGLLQSYEKIKD